MSDQLKLVVPKGWEERIKRLSELIKLAEHGTEEQKRQANKILKRAKWYGAKLPTRLP